MKSHSCINQGKPLCRISRIYRENFYIKGKKKKSPFNSCLHKIKFNTSTIPVSNYTHSTYAPYPDK